MKEVDDIIELSRQNERNRVFARENLICLHDAACSLHDGIVDNIGCWIRSNEEVKCLRERVKSLEDRLAVFEREAATAVKNGSEEPRQ